ncbi:hypothetical protein SNE40_006070 [Patella caerulea]|uniref:Gem-associated protein 7 n=1 Tax=Patella caerulea TaxID=87958 RepID=A0AAN8K8V1_PATCE
MVMENISTCQDQRTLLREKFLRMLGSLNGKTAQIAMYEKALVQGILGPADVDFHHFQVCELKTPMGVLPDAILRTSDMISIKIENVDQS